LANNLLIEIAELLPDRKKGDLVMVPCDRLVDDLLGLFTTSPLDRADKMLRALGVDTPAAYDAWVDMIGVDLSTIPIINPRPA